VTSVMPFSEMQTPERLCPPVPEKSIERGDAGCSKSERAQKDRADERKYGEHRQHIEPER